MEDKCKNCGHRWCRNERENEGKDLCDRCRVCNEEEMQASNEEEIQASNEEEIQASTVKKAIRQGKKKLAMQQGGYLTRFSKTEFPK
jgi:hypothetical protein